MPCIDTPTKRVEFRATEDRKGRPAVRRIVYRVNAYGYSELDSSILTAERLESAQSAKREAKRQATSWAKWARMEWPGQVEVY